MLQCPRVGSAWRGARALAGASALYDAFLDACVATAPTQPGAALLHAVLDALRETGAGGRRGIAALEAAFRAGTATPADMLAAGGRLAPWFASITFAGPNLRTAFAIAEEVEEQAAVYCGTLMIGAGLLSLQVPGLERELQLPAYSGDAKFCCNYIGYTII